MKLTLKGVTTRIAAKYVYNKILVKIKTVWKSNCNLKRERRTKGAKQNVTCVVTYKLTFNFYEFITNSAFGTGKTVSVLTT